MTNQDTHKNRQLDDQLAEFTDRLLDRKTSIDLQEVDSDDQTLLELQKMVARLANAFQDETVDEATAQRIEANLKHEWQKMGATQPEESPWHRWQQSFKARLPQWKPARTQKRAYALALASVTAIVVVVSLSLFFPEILTDQNLTGTELGDSFPFPALILFALVAGLLYLLFRNRFK